MACSVHAGLAAQPRTTIRVNGAVIAHDAIAREVQNHPAPTPVAAWTAAAQALVMRELLLQEARRHELTPDPATDEEGNRETDDDALIRALIERVVKIPDADQETCRRYYERNHERFCSPTIYEVAHILFAAPRDDPAAFSEAGRKAASAISLLGESPNRFADLARAHSDCPSGANGGNLGQLTCGQTTPEFEAALQTLEAGEITAKPVETAYGVHVIRLDRRIGGAEMPFEMVEPRIAEHLCEAATHRAYALYARMLVDQARIEGLEFAGQEPQSSA